MFGAWRGSRAAPAMATKGSPVREQSPHPLGHISWGVDAPSCPGSLSRLQAGIFGQHDVFGLLLALSRIRPSRAVWRQKDAAVSPSSL